MKIKVQPFGVPNFVITENGPSSLTARSSIPLNCLDADELGDLCDMFRVGVFMKAKKVDQRPASAVPEVSEDACVSAAVAFNRKAAAKCLPFRLKSNEDHECMRAALVAAFGKVGNAKRD